MIYGRRVLVLGDSHVAGPPGRALEALLRAEGAAEVVRVGLVGQGPSDWLRLHRAQLGAALEQARPQVILWWFGGNDLPTPATQAAMVELQTIGKAWTPQTWYLGPPSYPADDMHERGRKLNEMAAKIYKTKHINNQQLTSRDRSVRTPDGVHMQPSGANPWAAAIMRQMSRQASYLTLALVAGTLSLSVTGIVVWAIS